MRRGQRREGEIEIKDLLGGFESALISTCGPVCVTRKIQQKERELSYVMELHINSMILLGHNMASDLKYV